MNEIVMQEATNDVSANGGSSVLRDHQFMTMVVGAIFVSLILVVVSLQLYRSSGAAQLDLSLPSYQSARKDLTDDTRKSFPATGELNDRVMTEYLQQYDEQVQHMSGAESFGSNALSDQSVGIQ